MGREFGHFTTDLDVARRVQEANAARNACIARTFLATARIRALGHALIASLPARHA